MTPGDQLMALGEALSWRRVRILSIPGEWVFAVGAGRLGYRRFIEGHDEYWVKRAVAIAARRVRCDS